MHSRALLILVAALYLAICSVSASRLNSNNGAEYKQPVAAVEYKPDCDEEGSSAALHSKRQEFTQKFLKELYDFDLECHLINRRYISRDISERLKKRKELLSRHVSIYQKYKPTLDLILNDTGPVQNYTISLAFSNDQALDLAYQLAYLVLLDIQTIASQSSAESSIHEELKKMKQEYLRRKEDMYSARELLDSLLLRGRSEYFERRIRDRDSSK